MGSADQQQPPAEAAEEVDAPPARRDTCERTPSPRRMAQEEPPAAGESPASASPHASDADPDFGGSDHHVDDTATGSVSPASAAD